MRQMPSGLCRSPTAAAAAVLAAGSLPCSLLVADTVAVGIGIIAAVCTCTLSGSPQIADAVAIRIDIIPAALGGSVAHARRRRPFR